MKRISIYTTAAAVLLLSACSLEKTDAPIVGGNPIRFSASIEGFGTKAGDSGFETGDSFGLFALSPINAINIKYTLGSEGFTSSSNLTWVAGQTDSTSFLAYYPYAQSISVDDTFTFTVSADQTSHADYTASDFMLATAQARPEEKVALNFKHLLSRMTFDVSGVTEEVVSITLEDVATKASIDFQSASAYSAGKPGSIKAGQSSTASGKTWTLITVPQTCQPTVSVVTASGKQYSITATESILFLSGRETNARIRIIEGSSVASFTATIGQWADGDNLGYKQDESLWHPIGKGKIIDDNFCFFAQDAYADPLKHYEWEVEFEQNVLVPGYYRMVNPYKNYRYVPEFFTTCPEHDGPHYVYINASDPYRVYIEKSCTGLKAPFYSIDTDTGVSIGTLCSENGFSSYEGYGTLDDYGCISFPRKGLFFCPDGYKHYYSNLFGQTYITLPGGARNRVLLDLTDLIVENREGKYDFTVKTSMETEGVYFAIYRGQVPDNFGEQLAQEMLDAGEIDLDYFELDGPGEDLVITGVSLPEGNEYSVVAFAFSYGPNNTYWWTWLYSIISL